MKHGPAAAGANDSKITGTGATTVNQHKRGYREPGQEKDHLLLSFTFVTIASLSFWQKLPSLSIPLSTARF
jgi:hypothetical protein